jgi:NTE family protein
VAGGRGLVLGGGGITGIAWELGMVAALAERGVDLETADVVVGTSAGSAVGAQLLSGVPVAELYERQLADASGEIGWRLGIGAIGRFLVAAAWPGDGGAGRRYLGRAALAARTIPEADFQALFESMLGSPPWPERRLLITAVDAESGEVKVFDRDSGVPLADAVAASCAVPVVIPPITVAGRRYIDGGARSIANADLATGCDRVLVLAPVAFGVRRAQRIRHQLRLLGHGVRSLVVTPDAAARKAFGLKPLDPARRAAAARAGRDQAAAVVDAVSALWSAGEVVSNRSSDGTSTSP